MATGSPLTTPLAPLHVDYYEARSDGGYAWYVRYDLAFDGKDFVVTTDIDLVGAPPGATQQVWEQGIERVWNGKASLTDGVGVYDIRFDVRFVDSGADQQVTVHSAYGNNDMQNWYLQSPWGNDYQDELAAHEFGHMIGAFDEYDGGATYQHRTTGNTIMADLGSGVTLDGFFSIDQHAEQMTGRSFQVVAEGYALPPPTPAVNTLQGTTGADTIYGTTGVDRLIGGNGDDVLLGQEGNDTLDGGAGNDRLRGQDGNDLLQAGAGLDDLYGGNGNDRLWGQAGNDTLSGNAGADTFVFEKGTGHDRITDFKYAEGDRIALAAGMTWQAATASGGTLLSFGGGDDVLLAGVSKTQVSSSWFVAT